MDNGLDYMGPIEHTHSKLVYQFANGKFYRYNNLIDGKHEISEVHHAQNFAIYINPTVPDVVQDQAGGFVWYIATYEVASDELSKQLTEKL
tara:strand:+ start:997 stop:1269 length:273 start_codon:yes stop_codon:yes gene_type:complete